MRKPGWLLLGLGLLWPAAARAELTIETLALAVEVEGTKAVDSVFRVTLIVTGPEIVSASITPQGGPAIPLTCDTPERCMATLTLANQGALDALLPTTARNFTFTLTGAAPAAPTVTDTLSFARPNVASPAISAPVDGSVVRPGPRTPQSLACASSRAVTG